MLLNMSTWTCKSNQLHISILVPTSVVGRYANIIPYRGRVADVDLFALDYNPMQVPIFGSDIQYDCPDYGKAYTLVIQNYLHVP